MPAIALRRQGTTQFAVVILVTGGTGFIGSHTAVEALASGYGVVILDNLSNSKVSVIDGIRKSAGAEPIFVEGDCRDNAVLNEIFSKYPIKHVIHFAALKSVDESIAFPLKYYQENIECLLVLLPYCLEHGVYNFIFSSSAAVYGAPLELPLPETHARSIHNSPYGFSKIVCEKVLEDLAKTNPKMKIVNLRYFNPIGSHPKGYIGELPQDTPKNIMACMMQVAAGRREKLIVYGNDYDTPDGSCVRDFMHVVDAARAHLAALRWLKKSGMGAAPVETFNIGTGQGTSVLQLIEAFETITGKKLNYELGPRRPGDIPVLYADASKASRLLNWQTEFTVSDAIRDAQHWIKSL